MKKDRNEEYKGKVEHTATYMGFMFQFVPHPTKEGYDLTGLSGIVMLDSFTRGEPQKELHYPLDFHIYFSDEEKEFLYKINKKVLNKLITEGYLKNGKNNNM